jgi:diguanylate cyclase (GGDEF)-like protein
MPPAAPHRLVAPEQTAFRAEIRRATRDTGRMLCALGATAMPAWAAVDLLLEPRQAHVLLQLRAAATVAMVLVWFAFRRTRLGARHPERLLLLFLVIPEVAIAAMLARLDEAFAAYASGMSLALYASAFLLVWPWSYTAWLVGTTWVALVVAALTAPQPLSAQALVSVGLYMGVASQLALAGQWYRHKLARREFAVRHALEREQGRNLELLRRLERLTLEDALTGLANRRAWDEALRREVERARRAQTPLTLLLCDLDHFKQINDRHGHPAGDQVLKGVAGLLSGRVRTGDLVARLGGDEFAVLCPDTDLDGALELARDVAQRARELRSAGESSQLVTLSIGVAQLAPDDLDPEALVAAADQQLYRAKQRRDGVCAGPAAPAGGDPAPRA